MRAQLFCLPYAGGTAAVFGELKKSISKEIEVIPIEYAGHGTRRREPFYKNFTTMVIDVEEIIHKKRKREVPFGILGYSMGSLVLYELCRRACELNKETPDNLFLAAHEEPQLPFPGKDYILLSEDEFVEKLIRFGGTAEEMRSNMRMRQLFLPPVSADYQLLHDFVFHKTEYKFSGKSIVFYAQEDTPLESVRGWQNYLQEECSFIRLGNNHFFIKEYSNKIAEIINNSMLIE